MGYTTYWRRRADFTVDQWKGIRGDASAILKHCGRKGIPIVFDYDELKPPAVSATTIRFNGRGEEGHETFIMNRKMPEAQPWMLNTGESFDFCKTARKPYDLAVCLVLLSCVRHAPNSIKVTSDGDWDSDWAEARSAFKELFGVEAECPFFKEAA